MTLVASVGPLAAYAVAFQTLVYIALPSRLRMRWAPVVTGVVGAFLTLAAGMWFGFERIGLGGVEPATIVVWTVATGALVSLVGFIMLRSKSLRPSLADPRLGSMSTREAAAQIFLRIPVMTALIEEGVFRGVLHSALIALYPPSMALWLGAALFGAWHIGPGLDQAESNEAGTAARWLHTAVTVVATTVAGAGLVWLRMETGSIWAGVAVHATLNMTMAIFARRASKGRALAISS
jgi:uncharacterized protein